MPQLAESQDKITLIDHQWETFEIFPVSPVRGQIYCSTFLSAAYISSIIGLESSGSESGLLVKFYGLRGDTGEVVLYPKNIN
jgi:hypothetical protein